ncbi:MAG TPA: hypothetical protein VMS75_06845 [Terriglobales bacterium]|nr:hypothetical protein [Terriglobales bacterium]
MKKTVALLALAGLAAAGAGRAQTVDCLVAVVGGQPITLTDLRIAQEFGLFGRTAPAAAGDQTLAVLDSLIGQKLVLAMAREPGRGEADDAGPALADLRAKLGPEAYEAKLRKLGLREADLRPYLEERLRFERVVSARFAAPVLVSRGDVETYYRDVYVPEERAKGLEPAPLESVRAALETRLRAELKAAKIADWIRTIRAQSDVRVNRDCLKTA